MSEIHTPIKFDTSLADIVKEYDGIVTHAFRFDDINIESRPYNILAEFAIMESHFIGFAFRDYWMMCEFFRALYKNIPYVDPDREDFAVQVMYHPDDMDISIPIGFWLKVEEAGSSDFIYRCALDIVLLFGGLSYSGELDDQGL